MRIYRWVLTLLSLKNLIHLFGLPHFSYYILNTRLLQDEYLTIRVAVKFEQTMQSYLNLCLLLCPLLDPHLTTRHSNIGNKMSNEA